MRLLQLGCCGCCGGGQSCAPLLTGCSSVNLRISVTSCGLQGWFEALVVADKDTVGAQNTKVGQDSQLGRLPKALPHLTSCGVSGNMPEGKGDAVAQ